MSENEFANKSKEELISIILRQDKEIQELKKTLEDIQQKFKAEQQRRIERYAKLQIKKRHHKPGQKCGHQGITRPLPNHIDETYEQTLSQCPDCGHALGDSIETILHIQEDIIPARVVVRKYIRHRYYCSCCKRVITSPYHPCQVPQGSLGVNVLIQAAILKYHHCLPYNKIAELFKELAGLQITAGALVQSLQRLSAWLTVEQQTILEAIRAGPYVHIDETGWRLDGKSHWLWAFVNKKLAYYRIEQSRGRKVVKDTLTDKYQGTIISDFYGVYFRLPYKKQKCLVHLLRELHNTAKRDDSTEYRFFYKQIKRLVRDAVRLKEDKPALSTYIFQRKFKRIKRRLFMLIGDKGSDNKNISRIAGRFSKFWLDMLTFLEIDNVDWNNNLAERLIRPNVIYRNRSFGNRSIAGTKAHATLMSLIQTLNLQNRNASGFLKTAFLRHRQGDMTPLLSES